MSPTVAAPDAAPEEPPKPATRNLKDLTGVVQAAPYLDFDSLYAQLVADAPAQPADKGTVSLIVARPDKNEREIVASAALTVSGGMSGSGWVLQEERGQVDQICVMSTAAIRAIAGGDDRAVWACAGDQLFFDFDLSEHNLSVGDRVAVGEDAQGDDSVVLQVTPKRHNGCAKFDRRFGPGALKVVMVPDGKKLRLRGIYFHVVRPGVVREGDCITKVARDFGDM